MLPKRLALVAIALLVVAAPVQGATLWFVGDGSETNVAAATAGAPSEWPMSAEGHGAMPTSFQQRGETHDENMPNNPEIPTFIWPEPVKLEASAPVVVHMFVEDPFGGICGGMDGQLFDGDGNVLGPDGGLLVDTTGGQGVIEELLFTFEGIAGEFSGLQFQVAGHWTDCSSLPYTFHWGSDDHPSRLEGAVTASGAPAGNGSANESAEIQWSELTGETASVHHSFTNATNATYQYNWTTDGGDLVLDALVEVTSGSASVTILDAANETVLDETFSAAANETFDIDGEPGNWTILVTYTDFTGTLDLNLAAPPAQSPSPTGTSTQSSSTNDDNRTGTFPLRNEEQTPGLGPVALLVLVAVAGIAARRRLR